MTDDGTKLTRPKGRPRKGPAIQGQQYEGKSLDECLSLDDAAVASEYERLGLTMKSLHYFEDAPLECVDPNWSRPAAEEAKRRAAHAKFEKQVHRLNLFAEYLMAWIVQLSHAELIRQLEQRRGERMSEGEFRYQNLSTHHRTLQTYLWGEALATSKLYTPIEPPEAAGVTEPTTKRGGRKSRMK